MKQMKNKGISLIVLIITIVVIIVLATAIIVNLAQTNIIKNANVAVLKNDFQAFNDELQIYKAEQLLNPNIDFKPDNLDANYENILHNEEVYKEGQNIYNILSKLKGSKYDKKVYIQAGKIVVDSKAFTQEQINGLKEIGIEAIETSLKLKTAAISAYDSITAKIAVTLGEVEKYYFRLGETGKYIESSSNEYTFEGLEINTTYTIYMKVLKEDGEESIEYTETIATKDITGEVKIKRNPEVANGEYTSEDIKVTLSYEENIPSGYELQYKLSGGMTKDWTTYISEITIDTNNTTIYARLHNTLKDDEKASNSISISNIDKENPTKPTTLALSVTDNTITATASGSTDSLSGISKYEYSLDNSTWQDSGTFSDLDYSTTYIIYARAVDKVENVSESIQNSETIQKKYPQVEVGTIVTGSNATITGIYPTYNNPVIPVGFKAKETTEASWADENDDGIVDGWNNGLVIADENKNEFVWVPVDGIDVTYKKRFTEYPKHSSITSVSDNTAALPKVNGKTISENTQITTYGGFYVGRYEAGVPTNQTSIDGTSSSTSNKTGTPVSKQGATVWTYISYTNAYKNALAFCDTDNVKSGLLTGTQWDTVMKWIESSNINVSTDSASWGNYSDSSNPANVEGYGIKQPAGFSKYWKVKNIYDLAGNTWEWTGETVVIDTVSCRIYRGGSYNSSGSKRTASYRTTRQPSDTSSYISFRIVLYIM